MFNLLKGLRRISQVYSAGKQYEHSYQVAELSSMMYLDKLYRSDRGEPFVVSLWSYMFCTDPHDKSVADFKKEREDDLERETLELLNRDEPFRQFFVSTLWVGLAVCRAHSDDGGYKRILDSGAFSRHSAEYPLLSHTAYSDLVERWSQKYSRSE